MIWLLAWTPISRINRSCSSEGGSWPTIGISLVDVHALIPICSAFLITWSRAEISRRSVATGDWVASRGDQTLVNLEVAPVDPVVVGSNQFGQLDVLVSIASRVRPAPGPRDRRPREPGSRWSSSS